MSREKSDFLKECMNDVGPGPIDLFQKAFCAVCANRDCTRSIAGTLSFDRRMMNWERDLFTNVPRAQDSDPRYDQIRAKRFISIDSSAPNVVSRPTQVDPPIVWMSSEPEQPKMETHSEPEIPVPIPAPALPPPPPELPALQPIPEPVRIEKPTPKPSEQPGIVNTPFAQGIILPGYKKEEPTDTILEPGAAFTFGGEGNE